MLQLTAKIKIQSITLWSSENSSVYVTACLIMRWCIYEHKIKGYTFLVILPRLLVCAICVFHICMFANAVTLYYYDQTKLLVYLVWLFVEPRNSKTFWLSNKKLKFMNCLVQFLFLLWLKWFHRNCHISHVCCPHNL